MDIGGVNRIRPVSVATTETRNKTSADERDANGQQSQEEKKGPTQLTVQQEEEALKVLNATLARSGLTARLVKEAGKAPHIEISKPTGEVIRHLPYSEVIRVFLERKAGDGRGQLLKKTA